MKSLRIVLVCVLTILLAVGNAAAVNFPTEVTATVNTTSTISVTPNTFAFGTIGATATLYRFRNPAAGSKADVSYVAAGAYEIRVYTDNGVGPIPLADKENPLRRGFIRDGTAATAHRLYLKIWCPNISANKYISPVNGPQLVATTTTGTDTDTTTSTDTSTDTDTTIYTTSSTDYLWKGYDLDRDGTQNEKLESGPAISEGAPRYQDINGDGDILDSFTPSLASPISEGPSFSYIREFDTHTEGDTVDAARTRCVLAYDTLVRVGGGLGNPFPVCLGVDLTGVANGIYSSSNNGPIPPLAPSTLYPITPGQNHSGGLIFELIIY